MGPRSSSQISKAARAINGAVSSSKSADTIRSAMATEPRPERGCRKVVAGETSPINTEADVPAAAQTNSAPTHCVRPVDRGSRGSPTASADLNRGASLKSQPPTEVVPAVPSSS